LNPLPIANWTGFYAGVNVGAGWGTTETTLESITGGGGLGAGLALTQNDRSGILGGGQIGYNYQSGLLVFGVQGDIDGASIEGTTPCLTVLSCKAKSDWLATITGRFGGVISDRTLVYVKGGAAWLHTAHTLTVPSGFGAPVGSTNNDETSLGWLLGAGAEYAFAPNWSAFVEYNYSEFKKDNVAVNLAGIGIANLDYKTRLSIAKIGVNYKITQ
jgi:outer membrane immunogenic protein